MLGFLFSFPTRFFLSSLMLANTGNVEISTSGDEDLGNIIKLGKPKINLYPLL